MVGRLAEALPCGFQARVGPGRCRVGWIFLSQRWQIIGKCELAGNFLPGTQEPQRATCACCHIPQFLMPFLIIGIRKAQILGLEYGETPQLLAVSVAKPSRLHSRVLLPTPGGPMNTCGRSECGSPSQPRGSFANGAIDRERGGDGRSREWSLTASKTERRESSPGALASQTGLTGHGLFLYIISKGGHIEGRVNGANSCHRR
jgi:hypothetical protein